MIIKNERQYINLSMIAETDHDFMILAKLSQHLKLPIKYHSVDEEYRIGLRYVDLIDSVMKEEKLKITVEEV